ncbi:RNA polymerase sigma factor [Sorangium sp. So ce134]
MSPLSPPPHPPPPPDLVQHSTWTSMYATAVHVLPGMLRYLGVAEGDIDDLSQEVLLGAYTSLPRYDPRYPAGAYGVAFPPSSPSASSRRQDFVSAAALPIAAAATDAAPAAVPAHDPAHDPADPASTPLQSPSAPSSRSRPPGLGPRWRSESTWLFGIAWRKVRSHLERAYRRREVPVGLADAACFEGADVAPSSEQFIARKERMALATRLLAKIAPERRAILILSDAYEVPMHEIARALEINENTAASRLRLAREDYRAAVKRLRSEEQHALRSGLRMLPLFSVPSASFTVSPRSLRSDASSVVEPDAPATLSSPRSDLGRHDLADRPGHPIGLARLPRLAHVARLARPFARLLRPALAWGTTAIGGAVVLAALAPAPVLWANRVGPVVSPLLLSLSLSRAVHARARPETDPGEPPRSDTPPLDALSGKATSPFRTPPPAPPDGSGQHMPAAPKQHARSGQHQDPLAEELLLLDAARQALSQGDQTTAMDRIAAHERRFPQGRLKMMRERLRLRSKMAPAQSAPAGSAAREELP